MWEMYCAMRRTDQKLITSVIVNREENLLANGLNFNVKDATEMEQLTELECVHKVTEDSEEKKTRQIAVLAVTHST